jgi:sarcosine/dimethylglycine N-methyltransferase
VDSLSTHSSGVIGFYDSHPINEDQILAKLAARGANLDALTEDDLKDFDQDHYGGTDAVDALAHAAGLSARHHVLDVCSGMGGPARWFAHRIGCRVTGLDFTHSRVEGAARLTRRVGLEQRVGFTQGDATAMPFADGAFDAVTSQESWCHIADKGAVIAECARVLGARGVLGFTDIVSLTPLDADDEQRLRAGMFIVRPPEIADYRRLLSERRFVVERVDNLSPQWIDILVARLEMYRSLRDTTIAKFGEARFDEYDRAYSHFVGLFVAHRLGGVRIVARKA